MTACVISGGDHLGRHYLRCRSSRRLSRPSSSLAPLISITIITTLIISAFTPLRIPQRRREEISVCNQRFSLDQKALFFWVFQSQKGVVIFTVPSLFSMISSLSLIVYITAFLVNTCEILVNAGSVLIPVSRSSDQFLVRAMVIINPRNPSGQCLSEANLREILRFCCDERLVLFRDEVYQQNIYKDERPSSAPRNTVEDVPPISIGNTRQLRSFIGKIRVLHDSAGSNKQTRDTCASLVPLNSIPNFGISAVPLNPIPDFSHVHIGLSPTTREDVAIKCVGDNSSWRMRATKLSCSDFFVVKKYVYEHTCDTEHRHANHRQASAKACTRLSYWRVKTVASDLE
ncbi:hypothetical protein F2Q69_00036918 [Brassica cretica]|uniref:Aminotransferase class I/classII large domain-containing protein n=1 Tax=Brassica cretica TaxID=69181 RepID=A0A8S9SSN9_BRACR|nr:hypothetical protein F2Q69_00036918 [Brassica cretica]